MISTLTRLEKDGTLKKLVDAGFVSTKVLFYYEIYLEFDKRKKIQKQTTTLIVDNLANQFKTSTDTIYRCIKIMKDAEKNDTERPQINGCGGEKKK